MHLSSSDSHCFWNLLFLYNSLTCFPWLNSPVLTMFSLLIHPYLSHIFTTMSIFWRDGRNKYKARGGPKHFTLIISLLLDPRSQCPSLLASQQLSSIFNNPLHHKLCLAVTSLHLTFYNCFCSLHSGLIKTQMPNKIKKVFNFNNVKEKDNYEQLPTKLTKITLFNMVVKCKELLNTPI